MCVLCRAKNIQNRARINEDPKDAMLREFQREIEELKKQLAEGSGEEEEGDGGDGGGRKRERKSKKQRLGSAYYFVCPCMYIHVPAQGSSAFFFEISCLL